MVCGGFYTGNAATLGWQYEHSRSYLEGYLEKTDRQLSATAQQLPGLVD